ncbi:MAG: efflux RND transporter periplasmic adaptor subunit [Actinomycetota bacterium]
MKQRIIPVVIILVVLLALGGYWWYAQATAPDPNQLQLSGNIEAIQIKVAAQTGGQVKELKTGEGKDVKRGATLVVLDDSLLQLQLDQAKAAYNAAALSGNAAQANLTQQNVNLAEQNLKRATVTAPSKGTVLDLPYNVGELVNAGSVVATVADLAKVTLVVYVPEDKIGRISLDQEVDVATDSFPNRTFTGKITKISDQAEFTPANIQTKEQRVNLVFAVTISLSNSDHKLKPGMPADATITLK